MIPKNSKFGACNPRSKPLHITSNLDSCKIPHAKSAYKTNVEKKRKIRGLIGIWAHRWLQKSFKYLPKVSHGWLPQCLLHKNTLSPPFFKCFSCGAIIALLSHQAYLTWHDKKNLHMPFRLILLPTAATSIAGTPKILISCPSYSPIWVDGKVIGTLFRRRVHPCPCLHPFRVYENLLISRILLPIVAMSQLFVKIIKAAKPFQSKFSRRRAS